MREIDCAEVDEQDLVPLYLAGKLSDADAEAFEAHELGCDRCAGELARAGEIRSALGKPVLVVTKGDATRNRSPKRDFWTPLTAAAAIAIVCIGLRQLVSLTSPEVAEGPVLRGTAADSMEIRVSAGSGGGVVLWWSARPDAKTYRVKLFRSDGIEVLRNETQGTRLELKNGTLPPVPPGVSFLARVEAINPLGDVVARSVLTALR